MGISTKKFMMYTIIICCISILIIYKIVEEYKEIETEENLKIYKNNMTEGTIEKVVTKKEYPKEQIIDEYKGYAVLAKLEIPNINLKTYILRDYSTKALNISVTKFWGVDPNQIGNCNIAGHNFKNKNMFRNLKKLNIGDELIVTDNEIGKIKYEIFDIYTVLPENTNCLIPETKDQREITLITCTSDSKKRIIVKAKEV